MIPEKIIEIDPVILSKLILDAPSKNNISLI